MKLLAIVGSQRKNGNSCLLAEEVLKSVKEVDSEIVGLAERKMEFCNLCTECATGDCVLKDDFNQILEKMKEADGIVFSFPKYFSMSSKFLCFLERLATIHYFKEHRGFRRTGAEPVPNFSPPFKGKPCCIFVVSASGRGLEEPLRIVAYQVEGIGMKLVLHDSPPFLGVSVKGEDRGEVLNDQKGVEDCVRLVRKLVGSINH
jgi:multimeric flavodoxin WrbA